MGEKERGVIRIKKKHLYITIVLLLVFIILFSYTTVRDKLLTEEELVDTVKVVREPAVAGSWYPGTESSLKSTVKAYLDNAQAANISGKVTALIEPHAGYSYSGLVAAYGFKQLGKDYDTVILLGPSHHVTFKGASIANVTHYKTPLGELKLSKKAEQLREEPLFSSLDKAHTQEHCLEIEMPFVQYMLGDIEIIPIIIGSNTNFDEAMQIAETLKKYADDRTLIVVSSDFTHYGPNYGYIPFTQDKEENIKKLDEGAIRHIVNIDANGFYDYVQDEGVTICGYLPITILLGMMQNDTTVKALVYDTSGRQSDDYTNSVSYVTMSFSKPDVFDEEEGVGKEDQKFLLELARQTLESYLGEGKVPEVNEDLLSDTLTEKQGCFVTLERDNQLRGCIGHIIPQESLYQCVIANALNAALNDRRFMPVTEDELPLVDIEVSVLTVPEELEYGSSDELLEMLRQEIDGVIVRSGMNQATYLPQVWSNFNNEKETFMSSLCEKGGLEADCWKDMKTKVLTYQAQVFEEER